MIGELISEDIRYIIPDEENLRDDRIVFHGIQMALQNKMSSRCYTYQHNSQYIEVQNEMFVIMYSLISSDIFSFNKKMKLGIDDHEMHRETFFIERI